MLIKEGTIKIKGIEEKEIYYCSNRYIVKYIEKKLKNSKDIKITFISIEEKPLRIYYCLMLKFLSLDDKIKTDKMLRSMYSFTPYGNYDLLRIKHKNKKN